MGKILSSIIAFILSINSYTVIYEEGKIENENYENKTIYNIDIEESILPGELEPIKGRTSIVSTSSTPGWWTYPNNIKGVTKSGDDLLVLVNKEYQLPSTYAPSDLVSASLSGIRKGENFLLRNILINDLKELVTTAMADGIDLSIKSGYRSYSEQVSTYNYWVAVNGGIADDADKVSARAGHSQHQLGTVVDFSSSEIADGLGVRFSSTQASIWLANNAWKYGFIISYPSGYESITGYNYESWHYRYVGKSNAQAIINSGMILELYLRSRN